MGFGRLATYEISASVSTAFRSTRESVVFRFDDFSRSSTDCSFTSSNPDTCSPISFAQADFTNVSSDSTCPRAPNQPGLRLGVSGTRPVIQGVFSA
jgi:hypothetical protein